MLLSKQPTGCVREKLKVKLKSNLLVQGTCLMTIDSCSSSEPLEAGEYIIHALLKSYCIHKSLELSCTLFSIVTSSGISSFSSFLASITTLPCTHNSDIHTALNGADISSTVITEVQFRMKTALVFHSQDLCEFEKDIIVKVSRPCIKCSPVRCQGLKMHYTILIWLHTSYFL